MLFFVIALFITQFNRSRDKLKILKYTFIVVILIAFIWGTYPIWSKFSVLSRLTEIIQYLSLKDMVGVTNGRTVIYTNAIQLWHTNNWFGIGWGNFKYSVIDSLWYSGFDVHNCFLQILCETGIVGAVFYAILCFFSICNSCKLILLTNKSCETNDSNKANFCGYIQIFFILYSLTEPILYEYTDYMIFFCSFACTNNLLYNYRKRNTTI